MRELKKGYVIENMETGDWYINMGCIQVFQAFSLADYFREHGMEEPEKWEVVPVLVKKEKKEPAIMMKSETE